MSVRERVKTHIDKKIAKHSISTGYVRRVFKNTEIKLSAMRPPFR